MKTPKDPSSSPLKVAVKNGVLTASIGIETLAFASLSEFGGPLSDFCVGKRLANVWAKDVSLEMQREDESGNTPLSRFLDEMMEAAAESGSAALVKKVDFPPRVCNVGEHFCWVAPSNPTLGASRPK